MPVIENCVHCGKLCTDGFCPCRWSISVESMFDIIGPAPKEEGMKAEFQTCPRCKRETQWRGAVEKGKHTIADEPCYRCEREIKETAAHLRALRAERRAVACDAYMAALPMLAANESAENTVRRAADVALETVRRWDGFMAAVDALGASDGE